MDNVLKMPRTFWIREAHNAAGELLWRDESPNLIMDAAITDILEVYFRDGIKKPNWFIGLISSPASPLATDTAASHPGWSENVNYTATTRRPVQFSAAANKQVNSAAVKAVFTMSGAGGNIYGTFLVSDAVKGGTSGVLYAAAPFATGAKNLAATDVLTVSVVVSGA